MSRSRFLAVLFALVFLSSPLFADDQQKSPEYVDPSTGITHQFADGVTGQIITREQFIAQSKENEQRLAAGANRILGEAHQYMQTASEGEDSEITQGVISGLEQSKRDAAKLHAEIVQTAKQYQPRTEYERGKVLVSE